VLDNLPYALTLQRRLSWRSAMEKTTKAASVAAGLAFMVGVFYNFGYFNHLGLNYFTLLSYKDHLGAVVFVATPLMIIALFFLLIREPAMSVIDYLVGIFVLGEFVFWFATMGDRLAPIRPFVNDVINYSSLFLVPLSLSETQARTY
jgi:hypothetical protein